MKKQLLLGPTLLITGVACAQSSAALFGLVDLTLTRARGSIADRTQLTQGAYAASRIGVRGVESLGGGLSAGFHLEAAMFPDSGSGGATNTNNQANGTSVAPTGTQGLTFNRRSTVSLLGGFGEVRVGRDFVPSFWNLVQGDVFLLSGAGQAANFQYSIVGPAGVRASNMITYWIPKNSSGFAGSVAYYFGENASNSANSNDGTGSQVRLSYDAGGPLSAGVSYGCTEYASGDAVQRSVYAGYDFKTLKVVTQYSRDSLGALDARGGASGVTVPVGSHALRASYSWYKNNGAGHPKIFRLAVGNVYNFSKRTWVYATYARQKNSGGASLAFNGAITAPNTGSSALEVGLAHSF